MIPQISKGVKPLRLVVIPAQRPTPARYLFFRLPKLICGGQTGSIFRICRIPLGLFLAWKISNGHAFALYGPPGVRRPMRPGLYRHHLISFVGVLVAHFPFAPNRDRRMRRRGAAVRTSGMIARLIHKAMRQ